MKRRDFIKYTAGGIAALFVGAALPSWVSKDSAIAKSTHLVSSLNFTITDAVKDMITHNSVNNAQCYFWLYKEENFPAEIPGPHIYTTEGSTIKVTITNALDEPHAFYIRGVVNSGPIQPGETKTIEFVASRAGTYLYYDNLNEPVNRMMGLHGALIVMPNEARAGHRFTPYSAPSQAVQALFDDFGNSEHFPGLAWEEGDPSTNTPPFRQYVWVLHEVNTRLFEAVGKYPPGLDYPAAKFRRAFQNDPYQSDGLNHKPDFYTINGHSGFLAMHNPYITPHHRVGEPVIVRILNAGLAMHSMHLHANHYYVIGVNGVVQENVKWLDTFTVNPLDIVEWAVPFTRPPDIPNKRGIGLPDEPLISIANTSIPGSTPHPVWPPIEELDMYYPAKGTKIGNIDISVRLSPLCYPMHDHTEPSQSAQGGNYGLGMMSGIHFIGDRNTPGGVTTFPGGDIHLPSSYETGPAAGPEPHAPHQIMQPTTDSSESESKEVHQETHNNH